MASSSQDELVPAIASVRGVEPTRNLSSSGTATNQKQTTASLACGILGRNAVLEVSVSVNEAEVGRRQREAQPGQSLQ
jgi:hypothetical protein